MSATRIAVLAGIRAASTRLYHCTGPTGGSRSRPVRVDRPAQRLRRPLRTLESCCPPGVILERGDSMGRYRARHFLAVTVLLGLPAFTYGVGPVILDLIERVELIGREPGLVSTTVPRKGMRESR